MKLILKQSAFMLLIVAALFSAPSESHALEKAKKFATTLADQVLTTLEKDISDKTKLSKLEGLFKKHVDTNWIGKFVLGKHWRSLSADEQKRYLKSYQNFVVKNYTSKFTAFSGQSYKMGRSYTMEDGDHSVTLRIIDPHGGPDIITEYRVRRTSGRNKIVDIAVEGVSLITTQRSEFGSFVERKGIDSLIGALNKKAAKIEASL